MIGKLDEAIPDLVEPITAWRAWELGGPGVVLFGDKEFDNDEFEAGFVYLKSLNNSSLWPPVSTGSTPARFSFNHITAKCNLMASPCAESPCPPGAQTHNGKGCGIYGFKTLEDLMWDFPLPGMRTYSPSAISLAISGSTKFCVYGKVLMWGNVYVHERGYRAQYARVESLAISRHSGVPLKMVADVAEFYGVPLNHIYDEELAIAVAACDKRNADELETRAEQFEAFVQMLEDRIKQAAVITMKDALERLKFWKHFKRSK